MNQILDDKLTLTERGILITILLLKDKDPKIMLAKVKSKITIHKVREEMINLHKKGFIKWSGLNAAQKALRKERVTPQVAGIIDFMNDLYGRNFDSKSSSTSTNLINRLSQHSEEDIKLVISNRYVVWGGDPIMEKHLNPTTIFRPSKFDKYLEEARRTKEGERYTSASKIDLKDGDEISALTALNFSDEDLYHIKVYRTSDQGKPLGTGMSATRKGKDIKRSLRIQDGEVRRGGKKEYIYTFKMK